jgi:RNA polymerase sigma-70 factor (sigma-E family)
VVSRIVGTAWDGWAVAADDPFDDDAADWDADVAVERLFTAHYRSLVRLASLLLADPGVAEEITQDAYVQLHVRWRRLRDTDKALAYLRTTVVNRARSALRHRGVVARHLQAALPLATVPSAESHTLDRVQSEVMIAALRTLPARQREALVLRYYGDLSEAEVADAMGCSRGSVKSHTARGIAALRARTESWS